MSTYAVSDLHGCYEQWLKIRNKLKDNDTLYVLGDCIDRQVGGLGILQEAINDPRCIVLCGNHEDMMMEALEEELEYEYADYWTYRWFSNGGKVTYEEWNEAGRDFSWISKIKALPLYAEYTNPLGEHILLSHSGATPKANHTLKSLGRKALLWDRDCLRERHWHRAENEFHVFGHTPTLLMDKYNAECLKDETAPLCFCDNHKINIDNGACWTDEVCLLNLDTGDWEMVGLENGKV